MITNFSQIATKQWDTLNRLTTNSLLDKTLFNSSRCYYVEDLQTAQSVQQLSIWQTAEAHLSSFCKIDLTGTGSRSGVI